MRKRRYTQLGSNQTRPLPTLANASPQFTRVQRNPDV